MTAKFRIPQSSALTRPLDPINYFTNRLILILTLLTGIILGAITLFRFGDFGAAITAGLWTGAAVLQTWVIAREIDPEHDYSAFVGVALAFGGMLIAGAPGFDLLPTIVLVMLSRIVSRIVGPAANVGESIALVMAAGLMLLAGYLPLTAMVVLGLLLDGTILPKPERRQAIFAALAGGILLAAPLLNRAVIPGTLDTTTAVIISIIALAFFITILATRQTKVSCDLPDYEVMPVRIQAAMLLTLLAAGTMALLGGTPAVLMLLPTWAAMAGIPLFRLTQSFRK